MSRFSHIRVLPGCLITLPHSTELHLQFVSVLNNRKLKEVISAASVSSNRGSARVV
jgi:hypothetical protein